MATPDERKPENIPNMSLPERNPAPAGESAASPSVDGQPTSVPASTAPWDKQSGGLWKVGDRVMAPWEPMFLYTGTIREMDRKKALIHFDDGDEGWVEIDQLEAIAVIVGQRVLARRKMGPVHYPGKIDQIRGEEVRIVFDDGADPEWTRLAALRIPRAEAEEGEGALPTKFASNQTFVESVRKGMRVWATWNVDAFFAGTVADVRDDEALIHFDDGDQGWVLLDQLLPLELTPGMRVMSRWQMGPGYFPGTVTKIQGERIHVQYDDGDQEWTRPAALALPRSPTGRPARPTKTVAHGGGGRGVSYWIYAIGFILLALVLRLGCRALSQN